MRSLKINHNPSEPFIFEKDGLISLMSAGNNMFRANNNGISEILGTKDGKAEFICYEDNKILTYVNSQMGYPAIYPLYPVKIDKPLKAVLMDLDGTSVKSEEFWIWIIQMSTAALMDNPKFELEDADLPYVSGHSVSEHLKYCVNKYCPDKTVEEARKHYFRITRREMKAILDGTGRTDAFVPTEGLKDFLLTLKDKGLKIGLVTSGLYEKAWPEIYAAFKQLDMGDPRDFYDAIITAGYHLGKGQTGTLGELESKPHPWLYAETARVGLGIEFEYRHHVLGMEDSGAGVVSVRLAGFANIGLAGGNIEQSGTVGLCSAFCNTLEDVLEIIS